MKLCARDTENENEAQNNLEENKQKRRNHKEICNNPGFLIPKSMENDVVDFKVFKL